jgi:hypothetical protein
MTMHLTLHSMLVGSSSRHPSLPSYVGVVAISLLTDKSSSLYRSQLFRKTIVSSIRRHLSFYCRMCQLEPYTVELPSRFNAHSSAA